METIFIQAGLRIASFNDLFLKEEPIANKLIFIKDPLKNAFVGTYRLPSYTEPLANYSCNKDLNSNIRSRNSYYINEVLTIFREKRGYVVSEQYRNLDFHFNMKLQRATEFDFFESDIVKSGVLYYVKLNTSEVSGPFYMPSKHSISQIKLALNKGLLFVPSSVQNFLVNKKTAA